MAGIDANFHMMFVCSECGAQAGAFTTISGVPMFGCFKCKIGYLEGQVVICKIDISQLKRDVLTQPQWTKDGQPYWVQEK